MDLFDAQIAAKSVDPITSHRAAEQAEGLAARHHKLILRYLDGVFPMAAHYKQIAEGTGLDPVAVARRMTELERGGYVERFGTGPIGNGRVGTLWRIIPLAEAA